MAFRHAHTALFDLVYRLAGEERREFVSVIFAWENIIGSLLAQRAFVHNIKDKTLYVAVQHNMWQLEMGLQKQDILAKLNKLGGVNLQEMIIFVERKQQ